MIGPAVAGLFIAYVGNRPHHHHHRRGGITFTNGTNSIMQLSTELAMRGRVTASRVGVALGGTPIGAPIVGWAANRFGPRWSLSIGAAAGFDAAMAAVFALVRQKELSLPQRSAL